MKIFLLICFAGLLISIYAQNGRCPPRAPSDVGVCASNCSPSRGRRSRGIGRCRSGRICCRNGCGAYRCVSPRNDGIPSWCPRGSPRIRCFANPCTVMTCPRYRRARCRNDNPCEPACSGNFYLRGRRISQSRCQGRGWRG